MTIKNDAPKTNFAHKVKETKLSTRVKKRGVTAKMIWEYTREEIKTKGDTMIQFYEEYHALDAIAQNKLQAKHARRLEIEAEKKKKKVKKK
jgi:hypothetical protein